MKRISMFSVFAVVSTIVAYITLNWTPAREIDLNCDIVSELYDGTAVDRQDWIEHLGRTAYASKAWTDLDAGNLLWKSKRYRSAVNHWWQVAAKYRDCDAAYGALLNIATAEKDLGHPQQSVAALQILLLLPPPSIHDKGTRHLNDRHDACIQLADYYEQVGQPVFAERFLSQALYQEELHDLCGVYAMSETMELSACCLQIWFALGSGGDANGRGLPFYFQGRELRYYFR